MSYYALHEVSSFIVTLFFNISSLTLAELFTLLSRRERSTNVDVKKRKSRGKILFSSFCSIKVAAVYTAYEEVRLIRLPCGVYLNILSTQAARQFIIVSIILFSPDSPQQSIFLFPFFLLINHCQEKFLYVFSITTQIVLNSKHDVYYIARFRKRARSLPFTTIQWQQRRWWHHIVVNLFILMSKWYGWQTVYIVKALKTERFNFHVQFI